MMGKGMGERWKLEKSFVWKIVVLASRCRYYIINIEAVGFCQETWKRNCLVMIVNRTYVNDRGGSMRPYILTIVKLLAPGLNSADRNIYNTT